MLREIKQCNKIAIVGCAGSGKTTLALQLQEKFQLPLYHLDLYYWLPGWEKIGFDKFTEIHHKLCDQEKWIIEGSYIRVLDYRVKTADVIIFLDLPRRQCLLNVFKRLIVNWGKVMPDSPENCPQRFSLEFIKWVWNFNKKHRESILSILERCPDKKIYRVTSLKMTRKYLNSNPSHISFDK